MRCFGVVLRKCPGDGLPAAAEEYLEMARIPHVDTLVGSIHVIDSIGAVIIPDRAIGSFNAIPLIFDT